MFNTFSTWTDSEPDVFEIDPMVAEQERLIELLEQLDLAYDSQDIVHEFGLGFVEEHGVDIGTMVEVCYDPTTITENSWIFGQ